MLARSSPFRRPGLPVVLLLVGFLLFSCSNQSDTEDVDLPTPTSSETSNSEPQQATTSAADSEATSDAAPAEGRGRYDVEPTTLDDVVDVVWLVDSVTIDGHRLTSDSPTTLRFTVEVAGVVTVDGVAGCNQYFGDVVVAENPESLVQYKVSPLALTKKLCPDREDWTQFVAALSLTTNWSTDGETLRLSAAHGTVIEARRT